MAEKSFKKEVAKLRLGAGETFRGEGILAVTKALLQSGVSYVGGYQGAPISHLMDVLNDASDVRRELGIHFENNASEAAAAAMLAASIQYPLRGAVTWKSTVGTNVASDALSNVASAGVKGGALIIVGEDYGEGSSIIQERTHAFAMKSQIWLLEPKPDLTSIVEAVETGFELSEASNTPVMVVLRIRACHAYGSFIAKDNKPGAFNAHAPLQAPVFDYDKVVLPPSSFAQEVLKIEERWPAAQRFIAERQLNEMRSGTADDIGIIVQGGLFNALNRSLELMGLSDAYGNSVIPTYVMNVTYPIMGDEVERFCAGKKAVLMVEEGQPNYLEQAIRSELAVRNVTTQLYGKDILPLAGEYTSDVLLNAIGQFIADVKPKAIATGDIATKIATRRQGLTDAAATADFTLPARPPGFCTGCPERPLFSAMKLVQADVGEVHVSGDIGCHLFSALPPFNIGQHTVGYGLGLASSAGIAPNMKGRVISVMGDGGFWHNGLTTGVAGAVFNGDDSVLVIVENGYAAATGHQAIPSTTRGREHMSNGAQSIERAVKGVGVSWVRAVDSYDVHKMNATLREALTTKTPGLKVIISQGECQLQKQRRNKRADAAARQRGERVVRTKFGVDEDVCTGDHACIRLSGCPSLTLKDNPDPLLTDPVAHIDQTCVGCGNCGEVAHEAGLCPSFFKADVIENPSWFDRIAHGMRQRVISVLGGQ